MSRAAVGEAVGGAGGDPVRDTLRDVALLFGVLGASLVLLLLLSLVAPGKPQTLGSAAPQQAPQLAKNQVVASAERPLPAWHLAAQE